MTLSSPRCVSRNDATRMRSSREAWAAMIPPPRRTEISAWYSATNWSPSRRNVNPRFRSDSATMMIIESGRGPASTRAAPMKPSEPASGRSPIAR